MKTAVYLAFLFLFFLAVAAAMWVLDIPNDLPWYRILGGGVLLGIANILSEKIT